MHHSITERLNETQCGPRHHILETGPCNTFAIRWFRLYWSIRIVYQVVVAHPRSHHLSLRRITHTISNKLLQRISPHFSLDLTSERRG
ncbi:hypothetical protein AB1N83_007169 [Pleurotus pulmonarius]